MAVTENDDLRPDALERQSLARACDFEIPDREQIDAWWQGRSPDPHTVPKIQAEAETRLQHHENRAGGPGLRHASDRIRDWRVACATPLDAAEELGQTHDVAGHLRRSQEHIG